MVMVQAKDVQPQANIAYRGRILRVDNISHLYNTPRSQEVSTVVFTVSDKAAGTRGTIISINATAPVRVLS